MLNSYTGIFIPHHKIVDIKSKEKADDLLYNWQYESCTAEEWLKKLDDGRIIQPSSFTPKNDGTFTHSKENWISTYFICADADNIKGVEFDEETGKDLNPNGIEPWTEKGELSKRFPELKTKAYAVGESPTSMLREPPHRRYRIIFLFNEPIYSEEHFHQILLKFAKEFPIITNIKRSPAQPVYGNGREGFNFHICGNILNLEDYPLEEVKEQKTFNTGNKTELKETLQEFLDRHKIYYEPTNKPDKFYVECPYKDKHRSGRNTPTDAYVFSDSGGWAFYCSHATCKEKGLTTWESFKDGHGIKPKPVYQPPNRSNHNYVSDPPEWTEEDIEQSDEETNIVPFPEDLFFGIFKNYRDSLENRTPVPDAFCFATLKHIISASLGRRIHIESQKPIFPNIFTTLIGSSGEGHKGISLSVAKDLLRQADENVLVLTRTSTEEGLINLFVPPILKTRKNYEDSEDGTEEEYYINGVSDLLPHERVDNIVANIDSHESVRVMGSFEELSAVLNRTKKATFSGITETFMELYDMEPEILVGNKQNPSRAEFPTFTMVAASAFELIEQSLSQHFITAGLTNRMEWYIGEEKPPMFLYKNAEPDLWSKCISELKDLRDSFVVGQSFTITDEVEQLGDEWNKEFAMQLKEINNILIAGSLKRMKIFTLKNALIFAALEQRGDHIIHEEDYIKAVQLAEYNCTVVENLFGNFANSEHQRVCNRILEILKKKPLQSAKQIQNNMRWADIKEIHIGLDLMAQMEILGYQKPKRTMLYFVTKTHESE